MHLTSGVSPVGMKFVSTTMVFPTRNDHFQVFWGYHHLRKDPYINSKLRVPFFGDGKLMLKSLITSSHKRVTLTNPSQKTGCERLLLCAIPCASSSRFVEITRMVPAVWWPGGLEDGDSNPAKHQNNKCRTWQLDGPGDWNYGGFKIVAVNMPILGPWFGRQYAIKSNGYCKEKTIILVRIYLINIFRGLFFYWSAWLPWWRFILFDVRRFFKWVLKQATTLFFTRVITMEILATSGKMFYVSSLCLSHWWTFWTFGDDKYSFVGWSSKYCSQNINFDACMYISSTEYVANMYIISPNNTWMYMVPPTTSPHFLQSLFP